MTLAAATFSCILISIYDIPKSNKQRIEFYNEQTKKSYNYILKLDGNLIDKKLDEIMWRFKNTAASECVQ